MSDTPYRFTSGRMLHFKDCMHFYDDMPAREATAEELRTLPVCATCLERVVDPRSGPTTQFLCPQCAMWKHVATRTTSGVCSDCTQ
jgi:hypothetical protein